jgi:hypothetical protein
LNDEEYVRKYPSIQNWFAKGNHGKGYTRSTQRGYIRFLKVWCSLLGKNPDELANCENIDEVRGDIAAGLKTPSLSVESVRKRINALNEFWRCNGRTVDDVYGGIKEKNDLLYKVIKMRQPVSSPPNRNKSID